MAQELEGDLSTKIKMDGSDKPPATKVPRLEAGDEDSREGNGASEEQQQFLVKVVAVQNDIDQLNERASEEILHVEQKYNKLRQPFFEKRSELIKDIPDFWPTTLMNNSNLSEMINEDDEGAFQYLSNLVVVEYEDVKSGYKISFYFKPNPYFTNEVLSKEIIMESSGETNVDGTEINWKPGKDLTVAKDQSESKGRKRGLEDVPSFFLWFSETDGSSDPIAEIIKDDIWPNPLQFFLGGGDLNETYEEEEEEEGEEELDDEEDDDDPEEVVLSDEEDDDEDDG